MINTFLIHEMCAVVTERCCRRARLKFDTLIKESYSDTRRVTMTSPNRVRVRNCPHIQNTGKSAVLRVGGICSIWL